MTFVLPNPGPGLAPTPADLGLGVIAPYDFALDRELWRWTPPDVTVMVTRTRFVPLAVNLHQSKAVSRKKEVRRCAASLLSTGPAVLAYACTSGSFAGGRRGEGRLVQAMLDAGAPTGVTASGALLEALQVLGIQRLAVATPYDAPITRRLESFLAESGVEVAGVAHMGLAAGIWTVPYADTVQLVEHAAAAAPCDAVFVSCTNLHTYDIIASLEQRLGVPVLTANQVTMWAALRRVGLAAVGPGQSLVDPMPQEGRLDVVTP